MELQSLVTLGLSTASMAATAYMWVVRSNRERPRLKTHLMRLAVTDLSEVGDGPCCSVTFDAKTAVVNASSLPNVVFGVTAAVRLREGNWLPLQASFQAYDDEAKADVAFNLPPLQAGFLRLRLGTDRLPKPCLSRDEWDKLSWAGAVRAVTSDPLELKTELWALDRHTFADVLRVRLPD
jgi:hypothetical protein